MTQNSSNTSMPEPALCFVCREMFGNVTFDFMCSKCFQEEKKKIQVHAENKSLEKCIEKLQEHPKKQSEVAESKCNLTEQDENPNKLKRHHACLDLPIAVEPAPKNTCFKCSKKIGMLGYPCNHCSQAFCKLHRLPEEHSCSVDFIGLGKKKLKVDLTAVVGGKIEKL